MIKNPPANAGDTGDVGSIPGLGRSLGGENGTLLQYSCLGNPMDGGARRAPVRAVTKSRTRLGGCACSGRDQGGRKTFGAVSILPALLQREGDFPGLGSPWSPRARASLCPLGNSPTCWACVTSVLTLAESIWRT